MDNEMNVIETAATEVMESNKTNGLKTAATIGGVMTLGALAWEFGIKRIARVIKNAVAKKKAKKTSNDDSNDDEE